MLFNLTICGGLLHCGYMTPVETVIAAFGTVGKTARALGFEKTKISRWKWSGRIPPKLQQFVLVTAWDSGIDLSPYDIIFGKKD